MWSYIVGAITTPLYIIIPLLTIWVGVFPIAISWWAALALTMYYIAQSLVLNYCKKVRGDPEDPKPGNLVQRSHTCVHVCAGCKAGFAVRHGVTSRWHPEILQSACAALTSTRQPGHTSLLLQPPSRAK